MPSLQPEVRHRRLAAILENEREVSVSPSSVYRVLKAQDLVAPFTGKPRPKALGKIVTSRPNELWQTDICFIDLANWGTWYLISVLDDYSRFIVGHELCATMMAQDLERVVARAVASLTEGVPRPKLLSDNGKQMLARRFQSFLRQCRMEHRRAAYRHPETLGKLERWHRTAREEEVSNFNGVDPVEAAGRIARFVQFYNYERYHSGIQYLTPADRYYGWDALILEARARQRQAAYARRRQYYQQNQRAEKGVELEAENAHLKSVLLLQST